MKRKLIQTLKEMKKEMSTKHLKEMKKEMNTKLNFSKLNYYQE